MNNNNLAQKTNFVAGSDKLDLTSIYLTSVNIPGVQFSNPEVGGRAGTKLNIVGDTLTFNSLTFGVLVDEDFNVYHEFMDKIFDTVNPTSGTFASVEFDFWVEISNIKGNKLFKIEFNNCRIESVGDIELDTTSDETEFSLPVEVKYDFFNIVRSNPTPTLSI